MRTLNLIASLTATLTLGATAMASDNGTSLGDAEAARTLVERDLTNFICGTPDEAKTEDSDRVLDPAQIEIYAEDLIPVIVASLPRNSELNTQAPDSNAGEFSDPDMSLPAAQHVVGDLTGDNLVNVDDILVVLQGWGGCNPLSINACIGDVTLDGYVNQHDLILLFMHWN